MYLDNEGYDVLKVNSKKFYIDEAQRGGWGKFTMGLLLPTLDLEKSYGIYGMAKSIVGKDGPPKIGAFDASG